MLWLALALLCYILGAQVEAALGDTPGASPIVVLVFRRFASGVLIAVWTGVLLAEVGWFNGAAVLDSLLLAAWLFLAVGVVRALRGRVRRARATGAAATLVRPATYGLAAAVRLADWLRRPSSPSTTSPPSASPPPSEEVPAPSAPSQLGRPYVDPLAHDAIDTIEHRDRPNREAEASSALGRRPAGQRAGRWAEMVAVAVLLLLAGALFGRPSEEVLGARDGGIYFATGVAIASHGALVHQDPALQALAADLGDASVNYWLFQSVHGWPLRFPGQLFVRDLVAGLVEPGFLPWYPTVVAIAVALGGPPAGLWMNPVLATLAVLAVYATGRELFGAVVAWAGAALLTVNLAEVWFARYTLAEPGTQLLVWTGLYALAAAWRRPSRALGALAGLAWAGVALARVESVLLLPVVVGWLVWVGRRPAQRVCAYLALALITLGTLHALGHAWWFAPAYASMVISAATLTVAGGGIALTVAVSALLWLLLRVWPPGVRGARGRRGVALLGGALLVGALAAYFMRPAIPWPLPAGEVGELEAASRESLVRLGWYVTPLGLALATFGAVALVATRRWRRAVPLLGVLVVSLAFYLPNPLVSSDQPWAARRYLPVVLPGLLLLAAYGAARLGQMVARGVPWARTWARRRVTKVARPGPRGEGIWSVALARSRREPARGQRAVAAGVGSVLALAVGLGEWQATAPVVPVREQAGALAQIAELASLVPRDAILLFPRSTAGLRLSLPLHYVGERGAFVLPAEGPVDGVMEVVRRWREGGRSVYWIVPVGTRFPMPAGFRFVPAGLFTWDAPQLERPQDRLPRAIEANLFELQLYRVEVDGGG